MPQLKPDLRYSRVGGGGPILKWAGGKTRLVPQIHRRLPPQWNRYFEPFFGGGALFFAVRPELAVLGDANRRLMSVYIEVADRPRDVEAHLHYLHHKHNRLHPSARRKFYEGRRRFWNADDGTVALAKYAATLIYLNRTCFNGLYRENAAGQFNVPIGDYPQPQIWRKGELAAAALELAPAELHVGDYRQTCKGAGAGDFVYMDPPYVPVSETASFTGYNAGGFGPDHQRDLADFAAELVGRGCYVMVSQSDTRFVRQLYRGWDVHQVRAPRAINCDTKARASVAELILTAGYRC